MASTSVTITDYRTQIPGGLTEDRRSWLFPAVNATTTLGASTTWRIMVRLVRAADAETAVALPYTEHDTWTRWLPIADEYFDSGPLGDIVAWTDVAAMHIGGKRRKSVPTITSAGLNMGKRNATNPFTQALRDALGQYNKQVRRASSAVAASASSPRYPPMLATLFNDYIAGNDLDFASGIYVQPKYDGVRAVAVYDASATRDAIGADIAGVVFYSRTKQPYPGFGYIKRELFPALEAAMQRGMHVYQTDDMRLTARMKAESRAAGTIEDASVDTGEFDITPNALIYLDGEIYKHGVPLQDISGYARREHADGDLRVDYMVYDVFVPTMPQLPYSQRKALLDTFFEEFGPFEHCVNVPTARALNRAAIDDAYRRHLADGFEGAMVRLNAPYTYSNGGYHCKQLLKMKPTLDAEFLITGYTVGTRGKAARALMFVCKTASGVQFNVTPAMEIARREELARLMPTVVDVAPDGTSITYFDKNYRDKMLIVYFDEWSRDRVPQRARTEGVVRTWE